MHDLQKLQNLIDEYVQSESGAELVVNATVNLGALADFVIDAHTKNTAYQILAPADEMGYDNPRGFQLHDWLQQKTKDNNRLVLRSKAGTIYIIKPIDNEEANHDFAFYPIEEDKKKIIRGFLLNFARQT